MKFKLKQIILNKLNRKSSVFSQKDYDKVLDKYQQLKGIQLQGKEFEPVMQDIKTMFMSQRSAKDIIACMEWFADKAESEDREFVWTKNWTIKTIRLKLPEFLAQGIGNDVDIPSYAKHWQRKK